MQSTKPQYTSVSGVPAASLLGNPTGATAAAQALDGPMVRTLADVYSTSEVNSALLEKVNASRTVTAGTGLTGGGDLSADRTLQVSFGTSSTTACVGNDSRLSDARTPTAHSESHKSAGTDAIKLDELAAPTDVTTLNATTSAHGLLPKLGGGTSYFLRADGSWAAPPAGSPGGSTGQVQYNNAGAFAGFGGERGGAGFAGEDS